MRFGFILKPDKPEAEALLARLTPWLLARGHEAVVLAEDDVAPPGAEIVPEQHFVTGPPAKKPGADPAAKRLDFAVVLGGDGTMLRASALVGVSGIPVLGINLGQLGFLTPFDPAEAEAALSAALAGTLRRSQRMRLEVTYAPRTGPAVTRLALNDAVVHQGEMARLIEVWARLDRDPIATYRVDGLIVATPTGSTGYNLAAAGPILTPGQSAMTLTPICAHALTHRPLVLSASSTITIGLTDSSRAVVLTVDGQWARSLLPGDEVRITRANAPLVVFESQKGYFDILREKLHWGARNG